jgi:signal transduction histidine kinase
VIALLVIMASTVVGVLGIAQATFSRANAELDHANRELRAEMAQREQAEEALRQAQKMEAIGQLTGGVAHDFNNLLQVMLASLDIVHRRLERGGIITADDLRRPVAAAIRGAERAASLTQRLLAFARRQPLAPQSLDVNKLVSGMSEMLHRTLGEGIEIEAVLAAGLWRVSADVNQLESSLLNLAVNARDAMAGHGKLTVETANTFLDEAYAAAHEEVQIGQYVVIAVADNGAGMAPEIVRKAFDPFFTTKDVGQGTGLGLSQVYGFVKQSGGHVKIYSELGQGTTVKIYLPRLPKVDVQADQPLAAEKLPSGSKDEVVLVVEDEEDVRGFTVDMLRELGYGVMEAEDGRAALRLLETTPTVRLLFTDVGLPGGLNGRQLADAARRLRPNLRVLYTTGYARNAIVHHGRLDPGVALIAKPFTFMALATKVRSLFDDGSTSG